MFQVTWSERALDRLADIFTESSLEEQDRMSAAIEALNRRLSRNPFDEGESRDGRARVVFIDLLVVAYWIEKANRIVRVDGVTRYGR